MDVQHQVAGSHTSYKVSVFTLVVRTGGRTYGQVTTKISLKDMENEIKFSSLQGSARGYEEITYWVVKIAPSGAGTSAVG